MTTYRYTFALNDSQVSVLLRALDMFVDHCDERIASGDTTPYGRWITFAREISAAASEGAEMTSTLIVPSHD